MAWISSVSLIVLSGVAFASATTAQAANQLYRISEVSWSVKAHGNECSAADPSPGPYCGNGGLHSEIYSAIGFPQGIQCNPNFPVCPSSSTPTDGFGRFAPLGGSGLRFCAPWADWQGNGTTARPAKGDTAFYPIPMRGRIPPLYRNPVFFTSGGAPRNTFCSATSTGYTPGGKGRVQAGNPVTGFLSVSGPGGAKGGFSFPAAEPSASSGLRATAVAGELGAWYGYGYTYTYATLRNNSGMFGPGSGPGDFSVVKYQHANTIARMRVKQGAAKFGGTMTMLGALTTKVCYYRNGACSLGAIDWRYDAIGTPAPTVNGVVTNGHVVAFKVYYYHTALRQTSTIDVEGSRFPWTTGSVTVTAVGRGPHKTVHYARGYDNRHAVVSQYTGTYVVGTLQLVTPVLTRWLQPAINFETAGIGILRFVPEPRGWLMLAAGLSLLAVGYRMRKPASVARRRR